MSIRASIFLFVYPFIFLMSHNELVAQEKVPELVGYVIDPITNKGIEGVRVQLLSESDMRLTDAEGKFFFRSSEGFTVGRGYSFLLYKEGYISTSSTDNIILGRFGVLPNLFLNNDSDRFLWITVVDALDGTFLEDITIQIKEQIVITNERGRAKFDFSSLGNKKLKAFVKGECYQDRMVEVYAKDEKEIPLTYKCQKPKAFQETNVSLLQQTLDRALEIKDGSLQGQVKAIEKLIAAGYKFTNTNFDGVALPGARLIKTDFSLASFQLANLEKTNFAHTTLDGADLNFAYLEKALLDEVKAEKTYLQYIQGNESSFKKANLKRSSFFMSRLKNADFSNADLTGACLAYCDLTGADFTGANLTDAWFFGSVLDKAIFDDAIIQNTEASGAVANNNGFTNKQKQELKRISLSRSQDRLQIYGSTDNELSYDYKYPSFKGYYNGFHQIYPRISGTLDFREDSENRPIGVFRNFKGSEGGSISEYYWFNSTFWKSGGRGKKLKDNLKQHIKFLQENLKYQKRIEGGGEEVKRILKFLNHERSSDFKNPLIWNLDAKRILTIAEGIRDTSQIAPGEWKEAAIRKCFLDQSTDKKDNWPQLYPKNIRCDHLPKEHLDIYKKWTLERATKADIRYVEMEYSVALSSLKARLEHTKGNKSPLPGALFDTGLRHNKGISRLFNVKGITQEDIDFIVSESINRGQNLDLKFPKTKASYYIKLSADHPCFNQIKNSNYDYKVQLLIKYRYLGIGQTQWYSKVREVILVEPTSLKIKAQGQVIWQGKIYHRNNSSTGIEAKE